MTRVFFTGDELFISLLRCLLTDNIEARNLHIRARGALTHCRPMVAARELKGS